MEDEESSLSESEDDEIISSIRPSKKVIYSSESDVSDKLSDGTCRYLLTFCDSRLSFLVRQLIRPVDILGGLWYLLKFKSCGLIDS